MQEVNLLTVYFGGELRELVQRSLVFAPVVAVQPVRDEALDVAKRYTVIPFDTKEFIGPAGALESFMQVVQDALVNVDGEGLNGHRFLLVAIELLRAAAPHRHF